MNYLEYEKGLELLAEQILDQKIIPIFGAGFSKGSSSKKGTVPDSEQCRILMKNLLLKHVPDIEERQLASYDFSKTAHRFIKSIGKYIPRTVYTTFLRNYFTEAMLSDTKKKFLSLPWLFIFTLNIDDAIEQTISCQKILPYQNAKSKNLPEDLCLYKLHGDAEYELHYDAENNIVFDQDQYVQSLNEKSNQTICDLILTAYKEFNLLFIGCSLANEPDLKYIYHLVQKDEQMNKINVQVRREKASKWEEDELEDYGITDILVVPDYDRFYLDLWNKVENRRAEDRSFHYPYMNPKIQVVPDKDLKFFSGYKCFDEKNNCFIKSNLCIKRTIISKIQHTLQDSKANIFLLEGRRFSGKTSVLMELCENEKIRTVFYFPSTETEKTDVIMEILENYTNGLLLFDSNSVSEEAYYMFRDVEPILKENNHKIVLAMNQCDNYLPEIVEAESERISSVFDDKERIILKKKTNKLGLIQRKNRETNLDYLKTLESQQKLTFFNSLHIPKDYTKNEKILLLILCVKDKIYSKDINALGIQYREVRSLVSRADLLIEQLNTKKGERKFSGYKLVHNSKNCLLDAIHKWSRSDIIATIMTIVTTFLNGDRDQKRIYREVMQFDTLNQLFGYQKGAGELILNVYESLEEILNDDLHFWLQRAKSLYRLNPSKPEQVKKAYMYAKKAYMDSHDNSTLTTKAALSVSLICGLLYSIEKNEDYQEEGIRLGYDAIFSSYYRKTQKLNSDLEKGRKKYVDLLMAMCQEYSPSREKHIYQKAIEIIRRLKENDNE